MWKLGTLAGLTVYGIYLISVPFRDAVAAFWRYVTRDLGAPILVGAAVALIATLGGAVALWSRSFARRTLYAVTDYRVLVIVPSWGGGARWLGRHSLLSLEVVTRADGTGDLHLRRKRTELERTLAPHTDDPAQRGADPFVTTSGPEEELTLVGLRDVRAVANLIAQAYALGPDQLT